jgi:hypothetical protein
MIRVTVTLSQEIVDLVEDYRKQQKEIPSFSKAVNDLLFKALGI